MKRRLIDSSRDRRLLTALIVSEEFLARAHTVLDLELIDNPLFTRVAEWAVEYYKQYGKPAGPHIEDIYEGWSSTSEDSSLVDSVHDFLESLSAQYDEAKVLNVPFLLDELGDWMARLRLEKLVQDVEYDLHKGNTKGAETSVTEYRRIELGREDSFDFLRDDICHEIEGSAVEPLISFSGPAGEFFNEALVRDSLVGIQAPEKRGKTWWCVELVFRALRQRRKVALFEVGDLSRKQIMPRLAVRLSRRPMWSRYCGDIELPVKIVEGEGEEGRTVKTQTIHIPDPITTQSFEEGRKRFARGCGLSDDICYTRSAIYPNSSINVEGISSVLDQWAYEHCFVPDVIIVDYADILAPEEGMERDHRHRVNETWKALRRLSQERHALVIVPTQAKAEAYSGKLQGMKDFSEDKRKYAHVTGMLGISQTDEEKAIGVMRLNWIVLRESQYNTKRPLYVGTCFALGRALCCASF